VKILIILCYLFYTDYKLMCQFLYTYTQSKSSIFPGEENNLKKHVRDNVTFA